MNLNLRQQVSLALLVVLILFVVILLLPQFTNVAGWVVHPDVHRESLNGVYMNSHQTSGKTIYELNYQGTSLSLTTEGDLRGRKWAGLLSPWSEQPTQLMPASSKLSAKLPPEMQADVDGVQRLGKQALSSVNWSPSLKRVKSVLDELAQGNFAISVHPTTVSVVARDYAFGGALMREWSIMPPDTGYLTALTMTDDGFVALRYAYQLVATKDRLFEFGYRKTGGDQFEGIKGALKAAARDLLFSDEVSDQELRSLVAICATLEKESLVAGSRELETKLMKKELPWDPRWQGLDDSKQEPTVLPNTPAKIGALTVTNGQQAQYGYSLELTLRGRQITWCSAGEWARIALETESGTDKAVVLVFWGSPMPVNSDQADVGDEDYLDELSAAAREILSISPTKWPSNPVLANIRRSMEEVVAKRYSVPTSIRDISPLPWWQYAEEDSLYLVISDRGFSVDGASGQLNVALSARGFAAYDAPSMSLLVSSADGIKLTQDRRSIEEGKRFPIERFIQLGHVLQRVTEASFPGTKHGISVLRTFMASPALPPTTAVESLEAPDWSGESLKWVNELMGIEPADSSQWPW